MFKSISMLELRKKPGQVLDETYYKKYRFLVKRNKKEMAVIIPVEDFKRYIEDEDVRLYTTGEIKDLLKEDRLTSKQLEKAQKSLSP